jgi:hypothetical protein
VKPMMRDERFEDVDIVLELVAATGFIRRTIAEKIEGEALIISRQQLDGVFPDRMRGSPVMEENQRLAVALAKILDRQSFVVKRLHNGIGAP